MNDVYQYITDNYLNNFDYQYKYIASKSFLNQFSIKKIVINQLEYPYNKCKKMSNTNYRQVNCMNACTENGPSELTLQELVFIR